MATKARLRVSIGTQRGTVRPKPPLEELYRELDVAFDARDGKALLRAYRALYARRRDGHVGRRRACPVCLELTRPELSGEVIHRRECRLQAALHAVEAFIMTAGRTRDIEEARRLTAPRTLQ